MLLLLLLLFYRNVDSVTVTLHRADLTQLKSRQWFSSLRYIPSLISARSLYKNSAIEKFLEARGQLSEKLAIIASTLFHARLLFARSE